MAQRVKIELIDDLDKETAAAESVSFGLDGKSYTIDLSAENAARLRSALSEFVAVATPVGGRAKQTATRRRASASGNATDIRAWAQENGYTVSARGRVPAEIRAAYEAAH